MNRDTDYRKALKIQMEKNRSRYSRKISCNDRHRRDRDKNRHRDRDSKRNRDRNRSFEKRFVSFRDQDKMTIREEQPPVLPFQQSLSFPAYNYNALDFNSFGNNRYITIIPACTNSQVNIPWNINSLGDVIMSQSNININQSSSAVSESSNLENSQTSNFGVDSKRTQWDNPMVDITLSQSNVTTNQSSAVPGSSNQEISQASNFEVNSKRNRWDNPTSDIALSQRNMTLNQSSAVPVSPNLEMAQTSDSRVNLHALMAGIENCPQLPLRVITPQAINFASPVKEIIQLTKSVLYPPNPDDPCDTMTSRPLGCKKVIVGGLPVKASKEIIKEIFGPCGIIKNIRRSRKYCHIQFCDELSVEKAIYFSGYRLKIENKNEARYNGNLTVHYSQAQDDYEHKRQPFQYQSGHQEHILLHAVPYTRDEAKRVSEKLRSEDTFSQAACILTHWLEKGECKTQEAGRFYSMIHCIQSQANKLQYDKVKYEETLNQAKSLFKKQMDGNIQKLTEIEKIYDAASLQKCSDNFTKIQRINIQTWKKQTEEIKNAYLEGVINELEDEFIELSDDENDAQENDIAEVRSPYKERIKKLQEETNSLKCQLEAAQKEIKDKQEESNNKDKQLSVIKADQQNSLKEILNLNEKYSKAESELNELRAFKCRIESEQNNNSCDGGDKNVSSSINSENDVRLVSLISTFLIIQPFGATAACIWSYLHQIDSSVKVGEIEKLMKRFPILFKEESSGTEPNIVKIWKFTGFQTFITLS